MGERQAQHGHGLHPRALGQAEGVPGTLLGRKEGAADRQGLVGLRITVEYSNGS